MPDLTPPAAGLRRIHNASKQTAKVQAFIAPGEVLEVSATLAEQLMAQDSALRPAPAEDVTIELPSLPDVDTAEAAAEITKQVRKGRSR